MKFTDEELKQLQDKIVGGYYCYDGLINADPMKALLARLEAAEKVCNSCEMEMMEKHYDGNALNTWRKSKGE